MPVGDKVRHVGDSSSRSGGGVGLYHARDAARLITT